MDRLSYSLHFFTCLSCLTRTIVLPSSLSPLILSLLFLALSFLLSMQLSSCHISILPCPLPSFFHPTFSSSFRYGWPVIHKVRTSRTRVLSTNTSIMNISIGLLRSASPQHSNPALVTLCRHTRTRKRRKRIPTHADLASVVYCKAHAALTPSCTTNLSICPGTVAGQYRGTRPV